MTDIEAVPTVRPALPVVVRRHPFDAQVQHLAVEPGTTVAEAVDRAGLPEAYRPFLRVVVDDRVVPQELWHLARPKPGTVLYVAVVPQGGGSGGKNPLATILSLALVITVAAFAGPVGGFITSSLGITASAAVTTAIGAATISLAGSLLINALVPPPKAQSIDFGGLGRTGFQITGTSNRTNAYGPIPRVFGRRRIYPVVAARPFSESEGNDQYLRLLLCAGYGPLKITDIRIGQTPISQFEGVEIQVVEGWPTGVDINGGSSYRALTQTLYTNTVREEALSIELEAGTDNGEGYAPGPWTSRFTAINANEAIVDVTLPRGLLSYNDEEKPVNRYFAAEVQWRFASGGSWNDVDDISQLAASQGAVRLSRKITFPTSNQYEIRVRRVTATGSSRNIDQAYWTALRSVTWTTPIREPGLCLIAIRIKASEQLNGTPDQINCIAESWLPTWSQEGGWTWTNTRNPAWAYVDLMRRRGQEILLADSRIDLVGIRQWAGACNVTAPNASEPYWQFDGVIEGGSIFDAMSTVAAHGRASFTLKDGKYSVVRDVEQTVPVQHITPRNSWGYTGRKSFIDLPHALKVRFTNASKGFIEDERIVYDDGRNENNATRFETIDMPGCTSATQAWREGRYHLAVGQLRPEEHTVQMDVEAMRCTLGDLVRFSYDTVSIGSASGRLTGVFVNGSNQVTALLLDGSVTMTAGKTYGLRVRRIDGVSQVLSVRTQAGQTNRLELDPPLPLASAPGDGDLFMFGEAALESAPMVVKRITAGPDLTVTLSLVDAAQNGIFFADRGFIPDFFSFITVEVPAAQELPLPAGFSLRSDESALLRLSDGTLQDRIGVLLVPPSAGTVAVDGYEAQFRETGSPGWIAGPRVTADARELFLAPVVAGRAYSVRLRSLSRTGVPSAWTVVDQHVVIGKTTPPAAVQGFSAERRVDGVQLSWTNSAELDIAGYSIRKGVSWDSGVTVTERTSGTTLFVALDSAAPVTFLIRAVDTIGLLSQVATSLTTSVTAPDSPARLDVYPQGDRVRLAWKEVTGAGILYEIREGATWDLGRTVLRAAGSTTLVQWPIRDQGDRTWWIKALSSAGLYSEGAAFRSTLQAPSSNVNQVLQRDLVALAFPGVTHDVTRSIDTLTLDQSGGVNRVRGRLVTPIDLGRQWYARNWLEMRANVVAGSGLTWATATASWAELNEATWLGTLSDAVGVGLDAHLYVDGYTEPALVAGFTLDGTTNGLSGSPAASTATGVTYQDARWRQGAFVGDSTSVAWPVSVPSQFSLTFDVRLVSPLPTQPVLLATVQGPSRQLSMGWDPTPGVWYVDDRVGGRVSLNFPREVGDTLSFCFVQTAATRRLSIKSLRYPQAVTATEAIAPAGTFSTLALQPGPLDSGISGLRRANAVIADLAVWSSLIEAQDFAADDWSHPLGYAPRRDLLPGDYRYANALLELLLSDPARTARTVSITVSALYVDVPDMQDRGSASIPTGGAVIAFAREFSVPPQVNAIDVGGTSAAIALISIITTSGFTVQLVSAANPLVPVSGDISWMASGY